MYLKIFRAVVVGKFFARLYVATRENIDATPPDSDLAIRHARVIDKAGCILPNIAVDHARTARPEKILSAIFLHLLRRGRTPDVFDDARTLRYALLGKKTSAAERPANGKAERRRHEASRLNGRSHASFSVAPAAIDVGEQIF
jgi:hypothetical protein